MEYLSVEFLLNDRNSTLKLNVSQTIFVGWTVDGNGSRSADGTSMISIHPMRNSFEFHTCTQTDALAESGNLMTCRGLIRMWPESLVVNLNFTPLHPSFVCACVFISAVAQFELNGFFRIAHFFTSFCTIHDHMRYYQSGKCFVLHWAGLEVRVEWGEKIT